MRSVHAALGPAHAASLTPGAVQGIIGETYERLMAGDEARTPGSPLYEEDDDHFHGNMAEYVVDGFAAPLAGQPGPVLGSERDGAVTSRRRLAGTAAYPLAAAGRTRVARAAARKPAHAYRRLLS
jgi:hypothetical protein